MRLAIKLAAILLREGTSGQRQRTKGRSDRASLLIDVAFLTTIKCDHPKVSALAVELLAEIERGVGWVGLEKLSSVTSGRRARLVELPCSQISDVLANACLADADFLASRTRLLQESDDAFRKAVTQVLAEKGVHVPEASRIWARRFLGLKDPLAGELPVNADVNLERLSTLLLGAWEAKDDGHKAHHLFDLFSSMSRTAFHLSLTQQERNVVPFDPAVHEISNGSALPGQMVTVQRPGVQWNEGVIVRVIIKTLVRTVE
jgi:hypothetical protein